MSRRNERWAALDLDRQDFQRRRKGWSRGDGSEFERLADEEQEAAAPSVTGAVKPEGREARDGGGGDRGDEF